MSGLSIGGFKNKNVNEPAPIQVEPTQSPDANSEPQAPAPTSVEPPVNNIPEPQAPQTPAQTEPTRLEPVEPQTQVQTGLESVNDSSLTPSVSEPAQPSAPQIDEQTALTFLSERLGRTVTSLDDFKPVENPLDKDPYLKSLQEWRTKTGRPIEDFVKYQKDYSKMSDIEVAREILQHKYPSLDSSEIQLELSKYQASEEDLDADVRLKNLELKKLATEGRGVLENMKLQFSEPLQTGQNFTPEVQQDLDLAKQVRLQQAEYQQAQQEYNDGLKAASIKTENLQLKLSDNLTVNYKVSDESKSALPNYINEMTHWKNQDGSWNHQAVAEDGARIKHFDEIVRLVYEQGLNAGKEDLSRQANNTTLGQQTSMSSQQGDGGKGIKIGGLDKFLGGRGMKINKK